LDSQNLRQLGPPTWAKRSPGTGNTGASTVGDSCLGDNRQATWVSYQEVLINVEADADSTF
jgi:hypothetical protein